MGNSPDYIVCPKCKGMFVKRVHRSCRFCGVGLKYQGETLKDGDFFLDINGWVEVQHGTLKKLYS